MTNKTISQTCPYEYKRTKVHDSEIAYIESGRGDPILFLHGNPTSSYIWRNVIPYLEELGRCLAPDLIGMGSSGKSPNKAYRFSDHIRYFEAWLDTVLPEGSLTLVVQDWGAALGFDWGNHHRERIRGIAYMEAMVRPRQWSDLPEAYQQRFRSFRTEEGMTKALAENIFIEKVLPNGIARVLSEEEMAVYRAPYLQLEDRLPTIMWPNEIPFDGQPSDNFERVNHYSQWLSSSDVPKLFVNTSNGHALIGPNREFCRTWLNQTEITLSGKHYIQEDSPHELGKALATWYQTL